MMLLYYRISWEKTDETTLSAAGATGFDKK
jgi:hypothetical protein